TREVEKEVIAAPFIVSAKLGHDKAGLWIVNTRCAGIGIWVNCIGTLIERRRFRVRSRMWKRRVHAEYRSTPGAEKQAREQATTDNTPRKIPAAIIESAPRYLKSITGDVTVGAEKSAGAFPEIGDHNDVGLVITGACFDPGFPFTHIVGGS